LDRIDAMTLFTRIVEAGSFSDGAQSMGLSRAVASKAIQALENTLGIRLLNRTTRRLSVTEPGAAFYHRAVRIVADMTEAVEEAAKHHAAPRGTLRVNAPVSLGGRYVAPMLAQYLDRYPEMAVDLTLNDRMVDLVDEGFDVAIRVGRLPDSSLVARRLAPCPILLCASPAYLERHGRPAVPADLAAHSCLAYTYGPTRDDWIFNGPDGEIRVHVQSRFRVNNGDAIQQAMLQGLGIALQPCFIASGDLRAGRLVELLPDYRLPDLAVHAVYPAGRHLSAKVRSFVDFMAAHFSPPPWEAAG
jgi:DNA-binding transcriptional LysR family regulator